MRTFCPCIVLLVSVLGCGPKVGDQIAKVSIPAAPDKRGADAQVKLEVLAQWLDDYNKKLEATYGDRQAARKLEEESRAYRKSMAGKTVAGFAQFRRINTDPDKSTFVQLCYPHDRESRISVKVSQENAAKVKDLQFGDDVFAHGIFAPDGSFYVIGTVEKK